ncbi:MAG: GntR family transcriptional regulator [Granulosicoccus sp.]|nr:GntR family transcriptional regulator [Granulosicoccus sp.]
MKDQVYALLRQFILTGKISPGELIDEKLIASYLGISRTPVREAVRKLSSEHLVDVVAQSATRVSQLELKAIEEAYLIRRALEMESAAQASQAMTQEHADTLASIIQRHTSAIERQQFARAIDIDDEFHRAIAMISELERLWESIEVAKAQLDRCRHIMLPRVGQAEKTIAQHRAILRALKSGDPVRARKAMQSHLDYAYKSAVRMLKASDLHFPIAPKPGGRARKN